MKKFLSLMLCAVMVVCAILPCFAADKQLTTSGDSSPFSKGWGVVTKNFGDYADQPELFNNAEYWATHGGPDYSKPGFSGAGSSYITLWGGNEQYPVEEVWAGAPTFQVPFEVPADGEYSFAFLLCSSGAANTAGKKVSVHIDDGEIYQLVLDGVYASSGGKPIPASYYGMNNIYLTAGEHVFHFTKPLDVITDTQYYFGFKYTGEALVPETPVEPEAPTVNYDLTYTTSLPTAASTATYVSAKDTIAELNADLPFTVYDETNGYPAGDLFNGAVALGDGTSDYKFKINVPKDGDYSFVFKLSSGGNRGRGLASITVDGEGSPYTALSDGKIGWKKHEFYTGMKVTLTKGEHEVWIRGASSNPYFHGFYYYRDIGDPFANPTEMTATKTDAFASPLYPINIIRLYEEEYIRKNEENGLVNSASGASKYDFGVTSTAKGGLYDAITLHPAAAAPYTVEFTVDKSGLYEFRFDFISDGNGRGGMLQIDNELAFTVKLAAPWPNPISAYGMQIELMKGTHIFKLYPAAGVGCAYSQGFAYTLLEAYPEESTDEILDFPAGVMIPLPGAFGTTNPDPEILGQPMLKPINPLPDTDGEKADDTVEIDGETYVTPSLQPILPLKPGIVIPGAQGSHMFMPSAPSVKR